MTFDEFVTRRRCTNYLTLKGGKLDKEGYITHLDILNQFGESIVVPVKQVFVENTKPCISARRKDSIDINGVHILLFGISLFIFVRILSQKEIRLYFVTNRRVLLQYQKQKVGLALFIMKLRLLV